MQSTYNIMDVYSDQHDFPEPMLKLLKSVLKMYKGIDFDIDVEFDTFCEAMDEAYECKNSRSIFFKMFQNICFTYMTCYANKNTKDMHVKANSFLNREFAFVKDDIPERVREGRIKILVIDYYMLQKGTYSSVFHNPGRLFGKLDSDIFEKHLLLGDEADNICENYDIEEH